MLKKLLKYDLKNKFKFLAIFYSLAIFFAVLTRIFFTIENSFIMNVIAQICSGVTISMMFNIIINNLIRLWVRFKQNLYGDESYLTHTLPIKKSVLYTSKALSAFVSTFASVVVIAFTLFVAYYSKENIEIVKQILLPVANIYDSSILKILIAFFAIFFLEFANILQSGYTGIIIGHKMDNLKTGYSILFGFSIYMITQTLVLAMMFIYALFDVNIMNLFHTTAIIDAKTIKSVIYLSIAAYSILLIAVYLVNLKLFKKGVNVD